MMTHDVPVSLRTGRQWKVSFYDELTCRWSEVYSTIIIHLTTISIYVIYKSNSMLYHIVQFFDGENIDRFDTKLSKISFQ